MAAKKESLRDRLATAIIHRLGIEGIIATRLRLNGLAQKPTIDGNSLYTLAKEQRKEEQAKRNTDIQQFCRLLRQDKYHNQEQYLAERWQAITLTKGKTEQI